MNQKGQLVSVIFILLLITGCASVPMASLEEDAARKTFSPPPENLAGLYIYRNSHAGAPLKKSLYLNGELIGQSGPMTYFYKQIATGEHVVSTESEFGNNDLTIQAKAGKNLFVRQYIKMGVFVAGANLELVDEDIGKKAVLECKLVKPLEN